MIEDVDGARDGVAGAEGCVARFVEAGGTAAADGFGAGALLSFGIGFNASALAAILSACCAAFVTKSFAASGVIFSMAEMFFATDCFSNAPLLSAKLAN